MLWRSGPRLRLGPPRFDPFARDEWDHYQSRHRIGPPPASTAFRARPRSVVNDNHAHTMVSCASAPEGPAAERIRNPQLRAREQRHDNEGQVGDEKADDAADMNGRTFELKDYLRSRLTALSRLVDDGQTETVGRLV